MYEYFAARATEGAGNFFAKESRCKSDGTNIELRALVFLPPYDVGVSNEVIFHTKFDEAAKKYFFNMLLRHKTGIYSAWVAAVPSFATEVRKQLLNWRGITDEDRNKYINLGEKLAEVGTIE
jgi:hypothetical protein